MVMVSTRNKDKFVDGERVLCYEPDTTKAKVLYDSKVLEVRVGKDERGRKRTEYLIHFQGWNSSWDRVVSEDFILKDTNDNRQLQKDLAAKEKLQLGSYLYRKEHSDKDNTTLSEKTFEANSCSSQDVGSTEDHDEYLTATDDDKESSVDTDDSLEQKLPLDISLTIRSYLELDFELIHNQNKCVKLPAQPCVISILENYVEHYCCRLNQRDVHEGTRAKSGGRSSTSGAPAPAVARPVDKAQELEWICAQVNLAKELADGLRICFDHYLPSQLLYAVEKPQWEKVKREVVYVMKDLKTETFSEDDASKSDENFLNRVHHSTLAVEQQDGDRRRSLRSHKEPVMELAFSSGTNGENKLTAKNLGAIGGHLNLNNCSARSCSSVSSYGGPLLAPGLSHTSGGGLAVEMSKLRDLVKNWRLVPESYYAMHPRPPSAIYGAVHLTRLFVKLPSFLYAANLPESEGQSRFLSEEKMKILLKHLQSFLLFLETKPEWFQENHYHHQIEM